MDCIDLGLDYFLIKFDLKEDVDRVLKGGPWFVGQQFLAIRQWELDFRASTTTFSSMAVWVHLPELPIEYYDHAILRKIRTMIGLVLCIDVYMVSGLRGRFARLCVQVNLDKPLAKTVTIGKLTQTILYEGINSLCFSCGRLGHKKEDCPYTIRTYKESFASQEEPHVPQRENKESSSKVDERTEGFGKWMVVTRRKPMNKGKASHIAQSTQETSQESKTSQGHISKRDPRLDEQSRKEGKRKVPSPPTQGSQGTVDKIARSLPRKDGMKPDMMNLKSRAKANKQTRNLVQSERNEASTSNQSHVFSFGRNPIKGLSVGPSPTPITFSSPASVPAKVSTPKTKTRAVVALGNNKKMATRNYWAIFYQGKVIPIEEETIKWIKQDPTEAWG